MGSLSKTISGSEISAFGEPGNIGETIRSSFANEKVDEPEGEEAVLEEVELEVEVEEDVIDVENDKEEEEDLLREVALRRRKEEEEEEEEEEERRGRVIVIIDQITIGGEQITN